LDRSNLWVRISKLGRNSGKGARKDEKVTIATQWLIFGGVIAALFAWGLFAKEGNSSNAKEGHTAPGQKTGEAGGAPPEAAMQETAHV